jgi:hypothetical protein
MTWGRDISDARNTIVMALVGSFGFWIVARARTLGRPPGCTSSKMKAPKVVPDGALGPWAHGGKGVRNPRTYGNARNGSAFPTAACGIERGRLRNIYSTSAD